MSTSTIPATFQGHIYQLPADVDEWPLDLIKAGRVVDALETLLAGQWDDFLEASPLFGDIVPATHCFAAAAGFPQGAAVDVDGNRVDRAFGALPRVLAVLEKYPTAVASDLRRFWGYNIRDRARVDENKLTLQEIHDCLCHLPAKSALAVEFNGGKAPFTRSDLLIMDLFEAVAGRPHPARPLTAEQTAERAKKAADYAKAKAGTEARAAAHKKRSAIETAKENALRDLGRPAHAPEEEA